MKQACLPISTRLQQRTIYAYLEKRKYKAWLAFDPKILGLKNILNPTQQPGPGAVTKPPPLTSVGGR